MGESQSTQLGSSFLYLLAIVFFATLCFNLYLQANKTEYDNEFPKFIVPKMDDSLFETTTPEVPRKTCQPVEKLAFAKTHKTGGKLSKCCVFVV